MATTWSQPAVYMAKAVCTTGTETAPTLATDGLNLGTSGAGVFRLSVSVEANDGVTNLAAGTLVAYARNPQTGTWSRANDLDLTVVGGAIGQIFPGTDVAPIGSVAYAPSGLGTAVNVFVNGTGR